MSYELVSPQKIRHHSGYIVQGGDRFHLEYIESEKVLVIPVEDRVEDNYEIYWEKISGWKPPFDHIALTNEDKIRIKENVISALDFEKI